MATIICKKCNKTIDNVSAARMYCDDCKDEIRRERSKEHKRKYAKKTKVISCKYCGCDIIVSVNSKKSVCNSCKKNVQKHISSCRGNVKVKPEPLKEIKPFNPMENVDYSKHEYEELYNCGL